MRKILIVGVAAAAFALSGCGSDADTEDEATMEASEPAMDTAADDMSAETTEDAGTPMVDASESDGAMEPSSAPAT